MVNLNSLYLQYEVTGDQFCDQMVSFLNSETSNFAVYCCYFETMDEIILQLETYIQEIVSAEHF